MRVFIIEDDVPTVNLLTLMLEGIGHQVCGNEATEDEAVASVAACAPDLLIVDNDLLIGTGLAAMTKILTRGHIPHVFVSADLAQIQCEIPDAIMLQKPYGIAQMTTAINDAVAA